MIIVDLIKKKGRRASDLQHQLDIGQPTVSHHLKILKKDSVLLAKKKGREIFYYFNKKYPCKNCKLYEDLKL